MKNILLAVLITFFVSCERKVKESDYEYIKDRYWTHQSGYIPDYFGGFIDFRIAPNIEFKDDYVLINNKKVMRLLRINKTDRTLVIQSVASGKTAVYYSHEFN